MSRLALYLIGPPRVELDGEGLHIPRRKALALLAYLAVERHPHRRDSLAAFLWPEYDQSGARGRLRRTLSSLNRSLVEGYLTADRETIALGDMVESWLDINAFRQNLTACEKHRHPPDTACVECQAWLEEAVALYRDDFLAGFSLPDSLAFDEWTHYQSENLRDELAIVLERLAEILVVQERYEDAISHAKRWLSLDPLREAAHRCLMRLYALSDQEPAALRQFQECQETLKEELGVSASSQTVELMERIRAGQVLEPLREPTPAIQHNLPPQPTRLVGRETELEQLGYLVADPDVRLITIVGPGGIGKTRLALAEAERQLHAGYQSVYQGSVEDLRPVDDIRFPDGVYFVPLAQIIRSDEMAPAVAEALNLRVGGPEESRSGRQQVLNYLREKRMLLVLDNFEHLLSSPTEDRKAPHETPGRTDHGPGFVADVLRTAPAVQMLVTSRERLPLREEQAFPITGLEYADEDFDDEVEYAAAQLFLQAARRVDPSFELAAGEAASLDLVCRLLEGMPLAIELAATWVDVLPLADIAAEIQRGIGFLAIEWQDAPARHRSVRSAIDASWRRLTEVEQTIFVQLCVFRGGFTREAAREVVGADVRKLARLVGKSFLNFNRKRTRYEMHELLRQYGCERLAADPEVESATRNRHSAFYCAALGRLGDRWNQGEVLDATFGIEDDWTNERTAWERVARGGHVALLDEASDGLAYCLWARHRYQDGEAMFQLAADGLQELSEPLTADRRRVLAKVLLRRDLFSTARGRWELVREGIQQSRALLEDPALNDSDTRSEQTWLHISQAQVSIPDWETARWHFEQALELQRELGHHGQAAYSLLNIGESYVGSGEYDNARKSLEESQALFRALGQHFGLLRSYEMRGDLAFNFGNLPEAESVYGERLELADALGSAVSQAESLYVLAMIAMLRGDYDSAYHLLERGRQLARQSSAIDLNISALSLMGEMAWHRGNRDGAERELHKALDLARQHGNPYLIAQAQRWLSYTACAAGDFKRAEALSRKSVNGFDKNEIIGRGTATLAIPRVALFRESVNGFGKNEIIGRGTATLAIARVALFRGDPDRAIKLFKECLYDLKSVQDWVDMVRALEGLTWALADLEHYQNAARLLGFLGMERDRSGMILPPVDREHHKRALNSVREGLGEVAFAAASEEGAALTLEEAVELALTRTS